MSLIAYVLASATWVATCVAAMWFARGPLAANGAEEIVRELLGRESARYLGAAPLPLVSYFFVAMAMRHPLALILSAAARVSVRTSPAPWRAVGAWSLIFGVWALLSIGGAIAIAAVHMPDAVSFDWAWEIGRLTLLAGLPSLSVAGLVGASAKRATTYWLCATPLMMLGMLVAFGLNRGGLPLVFPGVIEQGLASGRDALRDRAALGAVAWSMIASILMLQIRKQRHISVCPNDHVEKNLT